MRRFFTKFIVLLLIAWGIAIDVKSQSTITGTVTSREDQQPLPGVNVIIKGSTQGATTNSEGKYSLSANSDDVLVFSFIGFSAEEVVVGDKTTINMALSPSIDQLREVVVTGYTEKKKSEIPGAITNLSADQLKGVTGPNVEYQLQGKVAGVQVSSASGEPGATPEIKIRGTTSINAERAPLFVVDGIIGGSYNPNDVESVTVLKDAGAVALYGSRANSGVIIITTKRARTEAPQLTYKATMGNRQMTTGNFEMMSGSEIYDTERKMFTSSATFKNFRPSEELRGRNYDWLNTAYHNATIQNHYLSISQKFKKVAYYLGADYYNEEGTLLDTRYKRLNVRSNIDYTLNDRIKLTTNVNIISDNNSYAGEWQWTYNAYLYLPYDSPYDENGNLRYVDASTPDFYTRDKLNILHNAKYNSYVNRGFTINADGIITISIASWLDFQSRNRISHYSSRDDQYKDARTVEGSAVNGQVGFSTNLNVSGITTNLLKFHHDFSVDHHFSGFVGFEGASETRESAGSTAIGIASGLDVPGAASTPNSISGTKEVVRAMSVLSEVSYDYKNKYFVSASFRRDGSSLFGADNRWGNFPSLAAAWLISSEDFFNTQNVVSFLKLRSSYGVIGNDNISPYQSLAKYNFLVQYNGSPGGYPATLPNPDLSWEETKTVDVGLEFQLFDRIDFTVDVFNKNTDRLLQYVQLPISQGFEQALRNVGMVTNKGLEFSVGGNAIQKGKFKWYTSFNIAAIRNNVESLPGGEDIRQGGEVNQLLREGHSLGSWYMPKWLGVDPANGDPLWEHIDYDGDGNETGRSTTNDYSQATYQIVGSANPKFYGGFNNEFSYGGFSLSINTNFQYGNKVYHRTREFVDSDGAYFGFNLMKLKDGWKRWENPGDNATHPKLVYNGNLLSNKTSSRYLEDGSYLRIRNVTLGYDVPKNFITRFRINSLRVFVSADNLLTITKFSGLDPEVSSFGNTNYYEIPGVSDFKYPINKQYLFGIQAQF